MECSCPPGICRGEASIWDCRARRLDRLLADPELLEQVAYEIWSGKLDTTPLPEIREAIDQRARENPIFEEGKWFTNEYGTAGYRSHEVGGFQWRWVGATVSFRLFGKRRIGKVDRARPYNHKLLVVLWDGSKHVAVYAPYQAFRKEEQQATD